MHSHHRPTPLPAKITLQKQQKKPGRPEKRWVGHFPDVDKKIDIDGFLSILERSYRTFHHLQFSRLPSALPRRPDSRQISSTTCLLILPTTESKLCHEYLIRRDSDPQRPALTCLGCTILIQITGAIQDSTACFFKRQKSSCLKILQ